MLPFVLSFAPMIYDTVELGFRTELDALETERAGNSSAEPPTSGRDVHLAKNVLSETGRFPPACGELPLPRTSITRANIEPLPRARLRVGSDMLP